MLDSNSKTVIQLLVILLGVKIIRKEKDLLCVRLDDQAILHLQPIKLLDAETDLGFSQSQLLIKK